MRYSAVSILSNTDKRPDGSRKFLAHFTVFPYSDHASLILGDAPNTPSQMVPLSQMVEWVSFAHWIGEKVIYFHQPEGNRSPIQVHVEIKGVQ
jgi:hypothetical protein